MSEHKPLGNISKAQIHNEALPVLYSGKTFHVLCSPPEYEDVAGYQWQEGHHVVRLEDSFGRKLVRSVVAELRCHLYLELERFYWYWSQIEPAILGVYGNLETITLRLGPEPCYHGPRLTVELVRQHKPAKPSGVSSYRDWKAMLAKLREEEETLFVNESFLYLPVNGRSGFITALERGCDAIVLSQAQGGMKDMQFKVQTVRWTERSIMTVAPVKLTSPRTSTIDFGYDPDITDGIIAFQKPRLEG